MINLIKLSIRQRNPRNSEEFTVRKYHSTQTRNYSNYFCCTKGHKSCLLNLANGKALAIRENIFALCIFFICKRLSMGNTVVDLVMNTLMSFGNLQSNVFSIFSILRKILLGWICPRGFAWSWTGVSFLPLKSNIKLQFASKFAVCSDSNISSDTEKHFQSSGKQLSAFLNVWIFQIKECQQQHFNYTS